jgi:hypothetical protein
MDTATDVMRTANPLELNGEDRQAEHGLADRRGARA